MPPPLIPVAKPDLAGFEKDYVNQAMAEGWISSNGRFIEQFEHDFAVFCGVKHAISCCNGTVSLHLILAALGIGPGDEVLVPSFTYIASANAVAYTGAIPILVESDLSTWNLDTDRLEEALSSRTKALIAVHLYGRPCPMDILEAFAAHHNLLLIEDAAEAHGASVGGRRVGSFGHAASFSFYGNKIITTGEGGMVTTNDDDLARKLRKLRGQGMDPERRYWFDVMGFNYRMTNLTAAIGCAQLQRIDAIIGHRIRIEHAYRHHLEPYAERFGWQLPHRDKKVVHVNWLFSLRVPSPQRDGIMEYLLQHGIDSRPFFHALHTLPVYQDARYHSGRNLHAAQILGNTGLNLPTFSQLDSATIARISATIVEYFAYCEHESRTQT
jgi:perosamine synthetase